MIPQKSRRVIVLSVGGLRLALDVADLSPNLLEAMLADYSPFLLADAECGYPLANEMEVDLMVNLTVAEGPHFVDPAPGYSWRIDTRYERGQLRYASYYEHGWLDFAAHRGHLLLRPQAQPENFLRVAFAHLALAHRGLLLHASGLIHHGHGYVFFGHSGAGKSTVAGLAPAGSTLLSDDLVLLRLHQARARVRPQVWLHGVPFRGEALPAPRPNAAAPLAGLFALRQARSHSLSALPTPQAAAHLLACTPFIDGDSAACHQALAVCMAIARAMPVHMLGFARNPDFWQLISGEEARFDDDHE
jgi:hypothetical protein